MKSREFTRRCLLLFLECLPGTAQAFITATGLFKFHLNKSHLSSKCSLLIQRSPMTLEVSEWRCLGRLSFQAILTVTVTSRQNWCQFNTVHRQFIYKRKLMHQQERFAGKIIKSLWRSRINLWYIYLSHNKIIVFFIDKIISKLLFWWIFYIKFFKFKFLIV